jgi:hypothetical protein
MRLPATILLLAAGLGGCAPHDGEVSGDYLVYFSQGSSLEIQDIEDVRRIDLGDQANLDRLGLTPIDCRDLSAEAEGQRLPLADTSACDDTQWFWWFLYYPFYKKEDKIDAYRVEAVLTAEHDLQLTLHIDVPRFGDFRFGWVVDPTFQPTECLADGTDTATLQDVDGDWLENWAATEGTGTVWNLNAGAFQINPTNLADYWYIEQDWEGGYAFGRFEDDDFLNHATDYVDQDNFPLYLLTYDSQAQPANVGTLPESNFDYDSWVDKLREEFTYSEDHPSDLMTMGQSDFPLEVKIEDNAWRMDPSEEDEEQSASNAYGLENWVGVNTSWVQIDLTPDQVAALETGHQDTPVTGTFQVALDGLASASKVFVNGTFSLDHIGKDVWDYGTTLDEIKREENNTPECGEDRLTTDD